MIYLALGIALGMIAGFVGAVIYLRTYLKSLEKSVHHLEKEFKDFKVVYNITVPSSSTSFDMKDADKLMEHVQDLFRPF